MGGLLGERKATAFIIEAGEGPIHATVAGNGGVGPVADADPTDPVSWFFKRAAQRSGVPGAFQASSRVPREGL